LEIVDAMSLPSRVITLIGANNQREEWDISEFLLRCFDCILNTEVEGLGKILNGTTLGISGGWLICTLAHILQLLSEEIEEFLIKGDDVISDGSSLSTRRA